MTEKWSYNTGKFANNYHTVGRIIEDTSLSRKNKQEKELEIKYF